MTELDALKSMYQTLGQLIAAKEGSASSVTPSAASYEGRLSPELLAIKWYTPGTDYAGRPTQQAPGRAPAIPSQLDEIGAYTLDNWTQQYPPVPFQDYLLMLHDLVPMTDEQKFNIIAGRWNADKRANVAAAGRSFFDMADRFLNPAKYQSEADAAKAAADKAAWDAYWAAKEANKPKPAPQPPLPGVGTE